MIPLCRCFCMWVWPPVIVLHTLWSHGYLLLLMMCVLCIDLMNVMMCLHIHTICMILLFYSVIQPWSYISICIFMCERFNMDIWTNKLIIVRKEKLFQGYWLSLFSWEMTKLDFQEWSGRQVRRNSNNQSIAHRDCNGNGFLGWYWYVSQTIKVTIQ